MSELERKRLIASMGQCKASITRLEKNLKAKAEAKYTAEDLDEHKNRLRETFAKYQEFSLCLQLLTEEFDDEEGLIEERYLHLLALIELKKKTKNPRPLLSDHKTMFRTEEQPAPTVPIVTGTKADECERQETPSRRNEVTVELRKSERDQTLRERSDVPVSDSTDEQEGDSTDEQEGDCTAAGAELERLVAAAAGGAGPAQQLRAVRRCGGLLGSWNNNRRRAQLVAAGALPALVGCLRRADCPALQEEAARALSDAACGTSAWTNQVVEAGAVPGLLPLLESPHEAACEQALLALGIIVFWLRDRAIELGAVPPLLSLIKPDAPIAILRGVARVVRWLCRQADPPPPAKTVQEILPALNTLIGHTDSEVLVDTALAINSIAVCSTDQRQMVVASGVVPGLVPLLANGRWKVQGAALRALGSIAAGTAEQAQAVLDCGALAHFPALLSHQDETICRKALGFLANITAGNEGQVQAVIDAGLLPEIIEQLSGGGLGTQTEAARAVRSLSASGSEEQVAALIARGAIPPFCNLLGCEDTQVINAVLGGLGHVLQKAGARAAGLVAACGGRARVEALRAHAHPETNKMAGYIIGRHFADAERRRRNEPPGEPGEDARAERTQRGEPVGHSTGEQEGHSTGEQEGHSTGEQEGHSTGEQEGHSTGEQEGHSTGEQEGHSTGEQEGDCIAAGAELERLVAAAAGGAGPAQQLRAVRRCGGLLRSWNNNRRRAQLVAAGALPALVGCLRRADCPALQEEAARALGNAACGTSAWTNQVVEAGAVPGLLPLLESPHEAACEQALWALGNIVTPGLHDRAIELGAVPLLLSLIKPDAPIAILRGVARVVRWLCRQADPPPLAKTVQEILPALNTLIGHTDSEVLVDTALAINSIAVCSTDQRQMVVASGVVPGLVPLLANGRWKVQGAALRALGSIAAGTAEQAQAVLDCGALAHFPALLSHQDETICRKALGFLANITAGNEGQVQAVIDAGLLPEIIEQLSGGGLGTQTEAARAVRSLSASGSEEQVAALIARGAIPPFCNLLGCEDTHVINLVLASLALMLQKAGEGVMDVANLIQECGGRDRIQVLRSRKNLKMNCDIIERYFAN